VSISSCPARANASSIRALASSSHASLACRHPNVIVPRIVRTLGAVGDARALDARRSRRGALDATRGRIDASVGRMVDRL
jgi:hypothetical protein